ncbi:MAG: hypothetical protein R3F18_06790 [Lysobacterales bacterium]
MLAIETARQTLRIGEGPVADRVHAQLLDRRHRQHRSLVVLLGQAERQIQLRRLRLPLALRRIWSSCSKTGVFGQPPAAPESRPM